MKLREMVVREIEPFVTRSSDAKKLADRILAIPEIAEALRVKAIVDEAAITATFGGMEIVENADVLPGEIRIVDVADGKAKVVGKIVNVPMFPDKEG